MMDAAPPVFLAVDSGGTKTRACIADINGDIIGTGISGPSNYAVLGPVEWTAVIMEAIQGAKRETKGRFARAWIGTAGVTCNSDEKEAAGHIAITLGVPPDVVQVTNDTQLLCTHLATKGIVVIAGTGSVVQAFQKDTHGSFASILRVGGLGPLLGDEGGGFSVGREALRAVLYEEPDTERLLAAILDSWHLTSKEELLAASYVPIGKHGFRAAQSHIAALTPCVFALAFDKKDDTALAAVKVQATELARQIARAVLACGMPSTVCIGGSLFRSVQYTALLFDLLAQRGIHFAHVAHSTSPARDAALAMSTTHRH